MIPLSTPALTGREADYLARCVADNWISSAGPQVTELERRFADLAGRTAAIAVSSGTTALQLGLLALGVKPGDTVLLPDFTFAATANAVVHAGATPFFIDIDPANLALDPQALEATLAQEAKAHRITAVIAVDVLGEIAAMPRLEEICSHYGVKILSDAAGSIGSTLEGRPAGSFGDAAIFSLNGNKVVTGGGGGLVVTNDAELATRIRRLSTQARLGARYRYEAVGFNFRLTNLNAAVAVAQMERLEEILAARRIIAGRYDAAISRRNDGALRPTPRQQGNVSNHWLYSVVCNSREDADALVAYLLSNQIEARHFWEQLSPQAPYAGFLAGKNPVAGDFSGRIVSLPSSSNLSTEDQDRVIAALADWSPAV
jgi:dTDP-4-amino-4,6-dideoxygalactose transaminase